MEEISFLIDATGYTLNCAVGRNGKVVGEISLEGGAAENFPKAMTQLCELSEIKGLHEVSKFALCEGPGSMLGTRAASAALFSMVQFLPQKPKIYVYDALEAAAYAILARKEKKSFAVVAPSRKGYANILTIDNGKKIFETEVTDSSEFPTPTYLLKQRATPPERLAYLKVSDVRMSEIFSVVFGELARLAPETAIEAKSLTEREYVKWKVQAHI